MSPLTITAYSTALFSTWIFVDELGLLFDCGDGAASGLLQKARKVKHAFISHADRDHLSGIMQFTHLNVRDGLPNLYFPRDCGSFEPFREFITAFDPDRPDPTWHPLDPGDCVPIGRQHSVVARGNKHVVVPGKTKSFDFVVVETRRKLRPENSGLSGPDLVKLRTERGEDAVTVASTTNVLGYSADSPSLEPERWANMPVLIHEATFLLPGEARGAHSNLVQVLEGAKQASPGKLVLTHFSSRYSHAEIGEAVVAGCRDLAIDFPVHVVLPGEVSRDVLGQSPLWG